MEAPLDEITLLLSRLLQQPEYIDNFCQNFTCLEHLVQYFLIHIFWNLFFIALPTRLMFMLMKRRAYVIQIVLLWTCIVLPLLEAYYYYNALTSLSEHPFLMGEFINNVRHCILIYETYSLNRLGIQMLYALPSAQ